MIDFTPDTPPAPLLAEIVRIYERAAARLRDIVLRVPGGPGAVYTRSRAAQHLAQIDQVLALLRQQAAAWTSAALEQALAQGQADALRYLQAMGLPQHALRPSFARFNSQAVSVLARDTAADLAKAAGSMADAAKTTLHRMQATGVSNAEVNQILSGRTIIEGRPRLAIRELRDALRAVHGKTVTIQSKHGPIEFKTGYYAEMVARTKTAQATIIANHETLCARGVDLVMITGHITKYPCTAYVGKVFSLSGSNGRYPALASLPGGGPPFHPNCSKYTVPWVTDLATPAQQRHADPAPSTVGVSWKQLNDQYDPALHKHITVSEQKEIAADIVSRARATGWTPTERVNPALGG